jgi:CBS domain-containing membrane protein
VFDDVRQGERNKDAFPPPHVTESDSRYLRTDPCVDSRFPAQSRPFFVDEMNRVTDKNSRAISRASDKLRQRARALLPAGMLVNATERWRAVVGAGIGIVATAVISRFLAGSNPAALWLVAPLGASAVLVYAVPASPLAQPWSVIGGNTLSALIGVACASWIADPALAASVAVAGAIGTMFAARCLHPPGGAMALLAVMTHATHFNFAAFPALTNSVLLVLVGVVYNSATGRRYPHVQIPDHSKTDTGASRFTSADLDAVLARYNQVLDVSRDDLENILQLTEMQVLRRQLGDVRCEEIMSRDLITAQYSSTLQEAWQTMRRHRIKALPVVDRSMRILGIVTLTDFMRHADIEVHATMRERLQQLLKKTTELHTAKPEVAGQIMTARVRVASADRHILELVPIFTEAGHHHIPIIDAEHRLVGIITESDFVRALYRTLQPGSSGEHLAHVA